MSHFKTRVKAGFKYSWPAFVVLAVSAIIFPFFPHVATLLVGLAEVVVCAAAFAYGAYHGPFEATLDNFGKDGIRILLYKDPDYAELLPIIEAVLLGFGHKWDSHPDTLAKSGDAWSGYTLSLTGIGNLAGMHYRVGKSIIINPEKPDFMGTLRYEFGHAMMYQEMALQNKTLPEQNNEAHWLPWRLKRDLL